MAKPMADKFRFSTSQVFNFSPDSYLERTSRPVYAVVFLLPFIIFYELGTILINTDVLNRSQVRVVAFVWLQNFLEYVGFGGKSIWAAPALVVVVILLAFQVASGKRWRVWLADILPMTVECVLLAVPLIVLSLILHSSVSIGADVTVDGSWAVPHIEGPMSSCAAIAGSGAGGPAVAAGQGSVMADVVTGVGAGIYEELVFRLILICVLMMVLQDVLRFSRIRAVILSVLVSAALFSAHHHLDLVSGRLNEHDVFDWAKFTFRTIAGVYFAVLFAIRGFGITAGTHAFYDIIATCLNAFMFGR